ncbi:MAG: PilZ domain-containing protein [Lautropia sp.]
MSLTIANPEKANEASARPSVISLSIKEKGALYAAYMPFLQNGGLFVPTQRRVQLGDDLYVILTLLDDPAKIAISGKVAWITPAGTTGRQQGVGIQFAKSEASNQARARIEDQIGPALKSSRPSNTV